MLVRLLRELTLDLLGELDEGVKVLRNTLEFLLSEAAGGHRGGADADTRWGESRDVTGGGVLVAGDVDGLQDSLETGAIKSDGLQVKENHVAVGTTRDEIITHALEFVFEGLGVCDDLLLVEFILGGEGLLEGNRKSGDGVVVGTTLMTGEDTVGDIKFLLWMWMGAR